MITIAEFNDLDRSRAVELLLTSCPSRPWADGVAGARPIEDLSKLLEAADRAWAMLTDEQRLAAIEAHPPIGRLDVANVRECREQAGVAQADRSTRDALDELNHDYRERFGFIFLTDASGRAAADMLAELRGRLANTPEQELANAERQQLRILHRRLYRTLADVDPLLVSTHVLDTAAGAAAVGLVVTVCESHDQRDWMRVGSAPTGTSGRLDAVAVSPSGWVRLTFATADYAREHEWPEFLADVVVTFAAGRRQRAHVPLLLAPFSYSTYLGT